MARRLKPNSSTQAKAARVVSQPDGSHATRSHAVPSDVIVLEVAEVGGLVHPGEAPLAMAKGCLATQAIW